jgi:hypothetical protein
MPRVALFVFPHLPCSFFEPVADFQNFAVLYDVPEYADSFYRHAAINRTGSSLSSDGVLPHPQGL